MVLKRVDQAIADGDKILAVIKGWAVNNDGSDKIGYTAPSVNCQAQVIATAHAVAGFDPDTISYVETHGTGTPANDPTETRAIRKVFGEHAGSLAVSSTKSMHGHALGAAGALELVAAIGSLRDQVVPPTANFLDPDPECDLDYVPNTPREREVRAVLSNAFAFGGLNAVVALRRVS